MKHPLNRILFVAVFLASSLGIGAQIDPLVHQSPLWSCSKAGDEKLVWRAKIGSSAGGVALAGERVLVGSAFYREDPKTHKYLEDGGAMMCFNSQTGEFLWQSAHPRLPKRVNDMVGFVNSRPWVEGKGHGM